MTAITNAIKDLLSITDKKLALTDEVMKLLVDGLTYKGWDAKLWSTMLLMILKQSKIKITLAKKEYSSEENPDVFIQVLVTTFLSRGNKIDNIITRVTDSNVRDVLKALKSGLGIQQTITRSLEAAPYTITLARVAAAFPTFTISTLINTGIQRNMVTVDQIGMSACPAECQAAVLSGFAHCLFVSETLKFGACAVTLLHAAYVDRVINKAQNKQSSLRNLWQYHRAAITSDNLSSDVREKYLADWKLTADGFGAAVAECERKLKTIFDQKDVDEILNEAMDTVAIGDVKERPDLAKDAAEAAAKWAHQYLY